MEKDSGYTVSAVRRRCRRTLPEPLDCPKAVDTLMRPLVRDLAQEHFYGIYLGTRNRLLSVELISVGSLNASIVHPREVFKPAILASAASVIVVHNHPSGEPEPSEDDLRITGRLREVGELLGITLVDHVIVASGSFCSLKEEGHL